VLSWPPRNHWPDPVLPCRCDLRDEFAVTDLVAERLHDAAGIMSRTPAHRAVGDVAGRHNDHPRAAELCRPAVRRYYPKLVKKVDGGYVFTASPNLLALIDIQKTLPLIVEM
jgi:hypothetical protein